MQKYLYICLIISPTKENPVRRNKCIILMSHIINISPRCYISQIGECLMGLPGHWGCSDNNSPFFFLFFLTRSEVWEVITGLPFFCPSDNVTTCCDSRRENTRSRKIASRWHVSLILYCVRPSCVTSCCEILYIFFFSSLPGSPISKHVVPSPNPTPSCCWDLVYCVCIQIGSEMFSLISSKYLLI